MLTNKQLTAKIASVSKRNATLRADIQIILINAAAHAYTSRDVTFYTRLFAATSGMNRKLIAKWAQDYGFAILQKDGSFKLNATAHKGADFPDGQAVVDYLTDEARQWFADEADAAEISRELDVAARIKSLASQIKNAANKNTSVKIDVSATRAALVALQETLNESLAEAGLAIAA